MRTFSARYALRAYVAAIFALTVEAGQAQDLQPSVVPEEMPSQDRQDFDSQRAHLLKLHGELLSKIQAHDTRCGGVAENSPLATECRSNQASLEAEIRAYRDAVASFNNQIKKKVAISQQSTSDCHAVERQAKKDREAIEQMRRTNEQSQEELAEWSAMNRKAQSDAVVAAVEFTLKEYSADVDIVRGSVSKLEHHAADLAKKAERSR
jgi:hypothetical protein